MGGQSSRTRKITLENEEPTNVIKVSDDVVIRLRGAEEVRRRNAAAQQPVYSSGQQQMYPAVPSQPPPYYHYEPSLTSLQILQEAAGNIKKNDEYWENRLKELEKSHDNMKHIMEEEYKKAIDEMTSKKSDISEKGEVPCISKRQHVVSCYKKYPTEPMRCAKEVQAFTECVDSNRVKAVESVRG